MPMESLSRAVLKSLSYRVIGLTVTVLIAWLCTGRLEVAAAIGAADTAIKVGIYFLHERAWNRIGFGRASAPDCGA